MKKILKFIILSAVVAQLFACINLALAYQNHGHTNSKNSIGFQQDHSCHEAKNDCKISSDTHNGVGFYRESSKTESLPVTLSNQLISNHNFALAGPYSPKLAFLHYKIGLSPGEDFHQTLRL